MNSVIQLVSDLRSLGVVLSLDGERLVVNAPRGVMTPEIRTELSSRKEEILTFLRERNGHGAVEPEFDPDAELPPSRSQARLWFIEQRDPGNPVYHIVIALQLTGTLLQDALEESLRILVQRHESLRTGFHERGGRPYVRIVDGEDWKPVLLDLTHLPLIEAETEAVRRATEDARQPFALDRAPLFRATLIRIAPDRHLLLLVVHHIVADGWSIGILAKELGVLYSALAQKGVPSLPALPSRFRDYVRWEAGAGQQLAAKHLPWWLNRLGGALPELEIPGKRRSGASRTFQGKRISMVLEASTADQIREFCRAQSYTPFMFFLAAFKVLLLRYTGQTDFLIGTGTSNRQREEFAPLVGFFVNNLVLRSDLSGNPRFQDLLARVKETALTAYAHQDVPFDLLVQTLHPERKLTRNPLFEVAFTFQNVPLEPAQLSGLTIEPQRIELDVARMDLSVEVWPEGKGYRCDFEFSTDVFNEAFATNFEAHYLALLRETAADPSRKIENILILSSEDLHQVLTNWNDTARPYPPLPVHRIFEESASSRPDAPAILQPDRTITYGQLNQMANAVAVWLSAQQLPPHSFIAVCAPGTAHGIAAFLGILKAGHAYFPITTNDPLDRLRRIVADARSSLLLTTAEFRDRLLPLAIPATQLLEEIVAAPVGNYIGPAVDAGNPAYLMFTSGSTGKPKGVVVPHRAIVRLVRNTEYARFSADEVWLQVSALTFDASTLEIWGALLNGAPLGLLSAEQATPGEIGRAIQEYGITSLFLTTAFFHYVVAEHLDILAPLRQIIVGGDVLSPSHVARLAHRFPHLRIVNGYGPTENTTFTTCCTITADSLDGGPIPIGFPIANTRVFVLDSHGQPVPAGANGELYTAGDGLALGYLNVPEENARKFVTLHFDGIGNFRAYRTGDLVRWRADGMLDFLGRTDRQTKLHGYRIEPAEIEEALLALPSVRAAVVCVRAWPDGDSRLVAFVVPEPGAEPDPHDLRVQLRRVLSRPQIPAAFLFLPEVPRTFNGKVDYAALDAIPLSPQTEHHGLRDAMHGTEEILLPIFREILRAESATVEDDFFALGGHSLLAMQLLSRISAACGVNLSVADIFQNPSVEALAKCVDAARVAPDVSNAETPSASGYADPQSSLVIAQPKGSRCPIFLVAGFQGPDDTLLVLSRVAPHLGPDQPVYGFRPRWVWGGALYSDVEEEAREYISELRTVQPHGPYLIGGYCLSGLVALEMANQLIAEGERIDLLALIDTELPSRARVLFGYAWHNWLRLQHMASVVCDLVVPGDHDRHMAARAILRRKLKRTPVPEDAAHHAFYETRMRYQRTVRQYVPRPYPGRITLLNNENIYRSPDRYRGWRNFSANELIVRVVPGNHITMFTQHGAELAQLILDSVNKSISEYPGKDKLVEAQVL